MKSKFTRGIALLCACVIACASAACGSADTSLSAEEAKPYLDAYVKLVDNAYSALNPYDAQGNKRQTSTPANTPQTIIDDVTETYSSMTHLGLVIKSEQAQAIFESGKTLGNDAVSIKAEISVTVTTTDLPSNTPSNHDSSDSSWSDVYTFEAKKQSGADGKSQIIITSSTLEKTSN